MRKLYFTEAALAVTAIFLATASFADEAYPGAELFRANGCEAETLIPVMSDLRPGEVLYWQNTDGAGCNGRHSGGGKNILDTLRDLAKFRPPVEPEEPSCRSKACAS